VRRFGVAPADVKAHPVTWYVLKGPIDGSDYLLDEFNKCRNRLVLIGNVSFKRKVRGINLGTRGSQSPRIRPSMHC
jgi:hypothetical protein